MSPTASPNRQLAAIMVTDIVGFSTISRRSEDLALQLLSEHDAILRELFEEYKGRVVKTMGDAFLVEFPSVLNSVNCAIDIQRKLHERNASQPDERRFDIRIGIHLGDVVKMEGDMFGDGVNLASRLEPLAGPAGICVSRQVYDHVVNKVPAPVVSEGKRRLKNIEGATEVFRVLMPWQESGWEPPAVEEKSEAPRSIAVLPFADLSQEHNQEYFCDGMTEELIDTLAQVEGLKVVARSSVFAFKGRGVDVREVGRRLDVATVLEGSVRTAGNRARITAQLLSAEDGCHLWRERYDRELADVFTVQEEIALAIVDHLRIQLLGKQRDRVVRRHTDDPGAHSLYLEGRFFWNRRQPGDVRKAMECFQRAIAKDPHYALPYVGIADCHSMMGTYGIVRPADSFPQARRAAARALELYADLGEAHATLGWIFAVHEFNWDAAERELTQAISLSPSYAEAHGWHAMVLLALGRHEEAVAAIRLAHQLDPLSLMINANVGLVLAYAQHVDEAVLQLRRTIEIERRFPIAHLWLAAAHTVKGEYEAALTALTDGMQVGGYNALALAHLVLALGGMGRAQEAQGAMQRLLSPPPDGYHSPFWRAVGHFGLGHLDEGFALLDQAYEERDSMLLFVQALRRYPRIRDTVVPDHRYTALVQRMNLRP